MRLLAMIAVLGMVLSTSCIVRRVQDVPVASYDAGAQPIEVVPESVPAATSKGDDVFETTVRPILAQRCSPCHEPGGTMYAKMPFDQPATLRNHRSAALKRFSGVEKQAIEAWLSSATP